MIKAFADIAITAAGATSSYIKKQISSLESDLTTSLPKNHWMLDKRVSRDSLMYMTDISKREWYFQIRPDSGKCGQVHFPRHIDELVQNEKFISLEVYRYLPSASSLAEKDLDFIMTDNGVSYAQHLLTQIFVIWYKANCISDLRVVQRCFIKCARIVKKMNPSEENFQLLKIERRMLIIAYSSLNRIHPHYRDKQDLQEMESILNSIKSIEMPLSADVIKKFDNCPESEFDNSHDKMTSSMIPTLENPNGPSFCS